MNFHSSDISRKRSTRLSVRNSWLKLVSHRPRVIGDFLKAIGVADDFETEISVEKADRFFRKAFLDYGLRLARRLPRSQKWVVEGYLTRLDIENLKIIIRGHETGKTPEQMRDLVVSAEKAGGLHVERLARARDLFEVAERIPRNHAFLPVLEKYIHRRDKTKEHWFLMEFALFKLFWDDRVVASLRHLEPSERFAATELLAMRADCDAFRMISLGLQQGIDQDRIASALPAIGRVFLPEPVRNALHSTDIENNISRLFPCRVSSPCIGIKGESALIDRLAYRLSENAGVKTESFSAPLTYLLRKELEGHMVPEFFEQSFYAL